MLIASSQLNAYHHPQVIKKKTSYIIQPEKIKCAALNEEKVQIVRARRGNKSFNNSKKSRTLQL